MSSSFFFSFFFCSNAIIISSVLCDIWILPRAQQLHTRKHTRKWWQCTLSFWHMLFPCLEKTILKISWNASHNKEIWLFQPWSIILSEQFTQKWKISHSLCTQTCMTDFLLENKKEDILKNVTAALFHIINTDRGWFCQAPKWQKCTTKAS